ncbi:hypothetical protein AK812_SmicGene47883, partial [Symbiodinium microadriaticum]
AATLTAKLLERCPRARCTATEALKMPKFQRRKDMVGEVVIRE